MPLGVIFFIYESRPNVTADAAALCVKSGNAVILRGGKEAAHSSRRSSRSWPKRRPTAACPADAVQLVATTDRAAVGHFLKLGRVHRRGHSPRRREPHPPRGAEARMPVIKHFAGNCHVYLDRAADPDMAERLIVNAEVPADGRVQRRRVAGGPRRRSAATFLPRVGQRLGRAGHRDPRRRTGPCESSPGGKPPTKRTIAAEYLGPIISVKVVDSLDEAIEHINRYGSQHTEAIVTRDLDAARQFAARVDSSAVMVNASTRFNDGGEFGLGAEIGISTDKFHARGPCGINELTSYKYVVYGEGQVQGMIRHRSQSWTTCSARMEVESLLQRPMAPSRAARAAVAGAAGPRWSRPSRLAAATPGPRAGERSRPTIQAAGAGGQGADAGAADPARRLRPQLRRRCCRPCCAASSR